MKACTDRGSGTGRKEESEGKWRETSGRMRPSWQRSDEEEEEAVDRWTNSTRTEQTEYADVQETRWKMWAVEAAEKTTHFIIFDDISEYFPALEQRWLWPCYERLILDEYTTLKAHCYQSNHHLLEAWQGRGYTLTFGSLPPAPLF